MRFLTVATGRKPFGMARRGPRLTNLMHVSQKADHLLPFPGLIHQGFAAPEGCVSQVKEAPDQVLSFLDMNFPVSLLFRPTGPCNEQEICIGANRLRSRGCRFDAGDPGTCFHRFHRYDGDLRVPAALAPRVEHPRLEQHHPRSLGPCQLSDHPLAIVPALDEECTFGHAEPGYARVDAALRPERSARHATRRTGCLRRQDEIRFGRANQGHSRC